MGKKTALMNWTKVSSSQFAIEGVAVVTFDISTLKWDWVCSIDNDQFYSTGFETSEKAMRRCEEYLKNNKPLKLANISMRKYLEIFVK